MHHRIRTNFKMMMGAAAALLIAACSGGGDSTNNAAASDLDSNMMTDMPANDASALETAANATEPLPEANATTETDAPAPGGETGDEATEGNDVAGM